MSKSKNRCSLHGWIPPRVNAGDVLNIHTQKDLLREEGGNFPLNLFSHLVFCLHVPSSTSYSAVVGSGREKRTEKKKSLDEKNNFIRTSLCANVQPLRTTVCSFFSGCYNTNISPSNVPCSFCTLYCRTIQLSLWIVLQGHQCFMGSLVYACWDWVSICGASVLLFFQFFLYLPCSKGLPPTPHP